MKSILYSYALAKSLHESNRDYYDTFVPFVCMVLVDSSSSLKLSALKSGLKQRFHLDIPDHVLRTICNRGMQEGYLTSSNKRYSITPKGQDFTVAILDERDVERRANHLGEKLSEYMAANGCEDIKTAKALDLLISFIERNLGPLTLFFGAPQSELPNGCNDRYTGILIKFLTQIETAEPALFDIISDFVYGSVICAIVQARNDNLPKTLKNVDVYLDTNVLFSILGFDHEEVARPRRELLTLLQREGCRLFAFDFTFEEMVCVLKGYRQSYQGLWETVRVNSIYSNLKRQGKTPHDMDVIIADLTSVLKELGISVVSTKHDYYSQPIPMDLAPLIPYKVDSTDRSLYHDMLAIEEIARLRNRVRIRKLEEVRAIFITADNGLAKYDLEVNSHKEANSVPSVIADRVLTQILWIKNPTNGSLPLYSAIAAHSRTLFVNRSVWVKFHQILGSMDAKDAEERLSLLVYNNQLEDILVGIEDPTVLDEDFIIAQADRIRREKQDELHDLERRYDESLSALEVRVESHRLELQRARDESKSARNEVAAVQNMVTGLQEEVLQIRARIKKDAERKAERVISMFICIIYILITGISIYLWRTWDKFESLVAWLIPLATILGIRFSREKIMEKWSPRLVEKYRCQLEAKYLDRDSL